MAPVPIVVCGRNPGIAKKVRENLMPEFDVIHIILTLQSGVTDIPLLLSSKTPPDSADNFGSQNYANRPVAVAIGGGFDDDMFNQIKEACKDASDVVWARTDMSKMGKPPGPGEEELYGTNVASRVKEKLVELKVGQDGGATEGVYFF